MSRMLNQLKKAEKKREVHESDEKKPLKEEPACKDAGTSVLSDSMLQSTAEKSNSTQAVMDGVDHNVSEGVCEEEVNALFGERSNMNSAISQKRHIPYMRVMGLLLIASAIFFFALSKYEYISRAYYDELRDASARVYVYSEDYIRSFMNDSNGEASALLVSEFASEAYLTNRVSAPQCVVSTVISNDENYVLRVTPKAGKVEEKRERKIMLELDTLIVNQFSHISFSAKGGAALPENIKIVLMSGLLSAEHTVENLTSEWKQYMIDLDSFEGLGNLSYLSQMDITMGMNNDEWELFIGDITFIKGE